VSLLSLLLYYLSNKDNDTYFVVFDGFISKLSALYNTRRHIAVFRSLSQLIGLLTVSYLFKNHFNIIHFTCLKIFAESLALSYNISDFYYQ